MKTLREEIEAVGGVLENVLRAPGAYAQVMRASPRVTDAPAFPSVEATGAEATLRAAHKGALEALTDVTGGQHIVLAEAQRAVQAGRTRAAGLNCAAEP